MPPQPDSRPTIAANLTRLMTHHGLNQAALATRAHVSQKTISNLLRAAYEQRSIRLDVLDQVAGGLGIPTYLLLIPSIDPTTIKPAELDTLIHSYSNARTETRTTLLHIAEIASDYNANK